MQESLFNRTINHDLVVPALTALARTDSMILLGGKLVMEPRVKPEGILAAAGFNRALRRRQQAPISSYKGILNGYQLHSTLSDDLANVCRGGAVWASNYPAEKGPYNTLWPTFFSSHELKRVAGQEIVWIQSYGDNYRSNPFTGEWHRIVADTIGAIEVKDPKEPQFRSKRKILEALLKNKVVGVYMEGEPSHQLKRALPEAASTVLAAARLDKPTITASVWKDGDHLFLDHQVIKPTTFLEMSDCSHQEIADFVMSVIASKMPQDLRGVYR